MTLLGQSKGLTIAEPTSPYQLENSPSPQWVEVLVDAPYAEDLYTYRVGTLTVKPGDIVSVSFGNSVVGGIAIKLLASPPQNLAIDKIKDIEDVITTGFFPANYWQLLERVAEYYLTDLINVVRVALPPKLLGKSQKRVRLLTENIPDGAENFCSAKAIEVIRLLQNSKTGNYTYSFIQQKIRGVNRAIRELVKRKWLETYLQPPPKASPKLTKVVTFISDTTESRITQKQREVLTVLKNSGGELALGKLVKKCQLSGNSTINSLVNKGCIVIQERESLRLLKDSQPNPDFPPTLTQEQARALEIINSLASFATVLLHGVTGSGKTEVYLQAIAPILQQKKSALILVPEIGLTPQLTDRFRARFGEQVCVYHSALSDGERYDTWRQMLTGEPQVVIGTRSAVFAPLPNLGIIILDEEHDTSFKQNQPQPTYHAVKVAQWRAESVNCPLILGSATPSLESWLRATNNQPQQLAISFIDSLPHYYLCLPHRIQSRPLPPVEIVDMRAELRRGNRSIFSGSLKSALNNLKSQGKQAILFISRRGHSTFVSCRTCGYVLECPHCDVSLSYHYPKEQEQAVELLRCHYCNYSTLHPQKCPECLSPYLKFFGTGTQKVFHQLSLEFPDLNILRFDSDTTKTKNAHRQILEKFAQGEADILIGTQMLTKGIDLAQVTLVGVVSADGLLFHSDYRAGERAFQTLTQVAGRAGRGNEPGQVIIQTYTPQHPVIQAVRNHDYLAFTKGELEQRDCLDYPPYGKLILLRFSSIDEQKARQTAEAITDMCAEILPSEIEILGPAPANVMRVARRYRWQILLKSSTEFSLAIKQKLLEIKHHCPSGVALVIDVDPFRIE
jgi:primosomal protein N' (replication factor Y)